MVNFGFAGCYTEPRQADPFQESLGGVPHDDSMIGNGVFAIRLSSEGTLSILNDEVPVVPAEKLPNPSYLAIVGQRHLCVVSEGDVHGKLFVFSFDPGNPIKVSQVGPSMESGGSYPCHVIHIPTATDEIHIFVSNYGRDQEKAGVSMFSLDFDAGASLVQKFGIAGQGSRGDIERQLGSHTHSCAGCPYIAGEIFTADLGSDSIIKFELNAGEMKEIGRLAAPRGSGPRSIVFQNQSALGGDIIGVVSLEMNASIMLVRRRSHDGCLEALGSPISILPNGWPENGNEMSKFNFGRWASDIVWSNNDRFIFAAARLHNSISVFEVVGESLRFICRIPTNGLTPRCLSVSPSGEFLLICHQHSHDISSFKIDENVGNLTFINKIEVPCAACVKLY
jgi:6-phosphogluconolactonase